MAIERISSISRIKMSTESALRGLGYSGECAAYYLNVLVNEKSLAGNGERAVFGKDGRVEMVIIAFDVKDGFIVFDITRDNAHLILFKGKWEQRLLQTEIDFPGGLVLPPLEERAAHEVIAGRSGAVRLSNREIILLRGQFSSSPKQLKAGVP